MSIPIMNKTLARAKYNPAERCIWSRSWSRLAFEQTLDKLSLEGGRAGGVGGCYDVITSTVSLLVVTHRP